MAALLLLGVLLVASGVGALVDGRELRGISVWDKPLKFQLSFGLHLATLLVAVRLLAPGLSAAHAARIRAGAVTVAACCALEAAYITLQAARGRESHFNHETLWEAAMYYGVMGPAALAILAGTALLGAPLLKQPQTGQGHGLAYGMGLGLVVSSAATLVAVVPLSAGLVDGPGHWVGGDRSDASGLPLTGWSTTGGDLRVPHFFATHLAQAVPLAGWLADRLAPARAVAWCRWTAVAGVATAAATLLQALAGQPFVSP